MLFNNSCFLHVESKTGDLGNFWLDKEKKDFLKNKKKLGNDWYYRNKKINYFLNSNGYRCNYDLKQFNYNIDYYIAIGCSQTFGYGLHKEHRYSDIIESITSNPVINLGYNGGSAQYIFNNLNYFLSCNLPKPKAVFIQWPISERFMVFKTKIIDRMHIHTNQHIMQELENAYPGCIHNTTNFCYITTKNLLVKEKIPCAEILISHHDDKKNYPQEIHQIPLLDLARDCMHYGIKSQAYAANILLEQLK